MNAFTPQEQYVSDKKGKKDLFSGLDHFQLKANKT